MSRKEVMLFQHERKIIQKLSLRTTLLPICSRVFEKLAFVAIFEFIMENNLLSSTHPGFKPNHSCVNQLFSMSYSLFTIFDVNLFLEVSGAS